MKPNNDTAAICGLFCGTCELYPNDCHGCLSDKLTAHCVTCPNGFRDCAKEHGVVRCYECTEFPCDRLEHFSKQHWQNGIGHHVEVINDLQFMKNNGVESWVSEKTIENTCEKCGQLINWFEKKSHKCDARGYYDRLIESKNQIENGKFVNKTTEELEEMAL